MSEEDWTFEQWKKWIDEATYFDLLYKWRYTSGSCSWIWNEVGDYFIKAVKEKGALYTLEQRKSISTEVGILIGKNII